jgi:hypothetical protein
MSDYDDPLVEEILMHCLFAIGRGAQMDIERPALVGWRGAVHKATHDFIRNPVSPSTGDRSGPGEPRWNHWKAPVLALCESLGRLGAIIALQRGQSFIHVEDLREAFGKLQEGTGCPMKDPEFGDRIGFFCGTW